MASSRNQKESVHEIISTLEYFINGKVVNQKLLFGDPLRSNGPSASHATHLEARLQVDETPAFPSDIDARLAGFNVYFRQEEDTVTAPSLAVSIVESLNREISLLSREPVVSPVVSQTP